MKNFIGLNGHTFSIDPAAYEQVTDNLRDFHPMDWDIDGNSSNPTTFPLSRKAMNKGEKINWAELYGNWKKHGNTVDVSIQSSWTYSKKNWKNMELDARAYGKAFAEAFGPSSSTPVVDSVEIGNEPMPYSTEDYVTMFKAMAQGVRDGDPKMKILTCTVSADKPDRFEKPLQSLKGLEKLYDVINVHSYGFKQLYPTWERSYPEDPNIVYLKKIQSAINYRNKHAADKEVWVTEFGYDSCSAEALKQPRSKGMAKWVPCNDTEQAQWTVRSFLVFSAMDIERAYLYFYNDKDKASFHSASGITRNGNPKPAFYAMAHLYKTLGECRFSRSVRKDDGDVYAYEYKNDTGKKIWVVWSPTKGKGDREFTIGEIPGEVAGAERMPLDKGAAPKVKVDKKNDKISFTISESPVYIFFK